jgi:predicted O-linked N-acetylglucosamine transferase (SPINDLY family)
MSGMDFFHPIKNLSDEEAAKFIDSLGIDILVDLVGLTSNARPGIFLFKPAPILVSYLGFLGPVGISEIDYIICDEYVIPPTNISYYGAEPIYLPFYQINNQYRQVGPLPNKVSQDLPAEAFVFCAICNTYKITDEVFYRWMQILLATENSVLWLLEENLFVKQNLINRALSYGVDVQRIVFAKQIEPTHYLARFDCADLFLDTSPYNAGITATDAIWMGVPTLTCPGNTFVSRMAADLMHNLQLDEFICKDWDEYMQKAVQYCQTRSARSRVDIDRIRAHAIFDSKQFVVNLEAQYLRVLNQKKQEMAHDGVA